MALEPLLELVPLLSDVLSQGLQIQPLIGTLDHAPKDTTAQLELLIHSDVQWEHTVMLREVLLRQLIAIHAMLATTEKRLP